MATLNTTLIRKCASSDCENPRYRKSLLCGSCSSRKRKQALIDSGIICRVDFCQKPINSYKHELCEAHLFRFKKYGDPTAGQTGHGEALQWATNFVNATPLPNHCIEWPFANSGNGYGLLTIGENRRILAHRLCLSLYQGLTIGQMPDPKIETRHLCPGKPNSLCVNPLHLKFGTHAENMADNAATGIHKGSKNPRSKLDEKQILAILLDSRPTKQIAFDYFVSTSLITAIKRRDRWSHVKLPD